MRQLSLAALFGGQAQGLEQPPDGCLPVFDLFCGGGGFSCGAEAAGCKVVWACDMDEDALETHRRNHPATVHCSRALPHDHIPFPTDGSAFHLHGSPPCQLFSSASQRMRRQGDRAQSEALVEWFLRLALRCGATSWTMEEVNSPHVLSIVERVRKAHPTRVAYHEFRFEELGVPQTRHRLIAGSPELIAKLLRARRSEPQRSIQNFITKPRGTHIRSHTYSVSRTKKRGAVDTGGAKYAYKVAKLGDHCKPTTGLSPTILAGIPMLWVTKSEGKAHTRLSLNPRESALLQTFPTNYWLPENNRLALKHVGNAVPPKVATLLMSA